MSEVCHDVKVEPVLQPLTGEALRYKTAICEDDARVDICAACFGGTRHQHAYFDICVLIPWPFLTVLQNLVLPTATMSRRSAVHVRKGFVRLNMAVLPLWFFQLTVASLPLLTNVWPTCCPQSKTPLTLLSWVGYIVL